MLSFFMSIISFNLLYEISKIIIPTLWMRKLSYREIKYIVHRTQTHVDWHLSSLKSSIWNLPPRRATSTMLSGKSQDWCITSFRECINKNTTAKTRDLCHLDIIPLLLFCIIFWWLRRKYTKQITKKNLETCMVSSKT